MQRRRLMPVTALLSVTALVGAGAVAAQDASPSPGSTGVSPSLPPQQSPSGSPEASPSGPVITVTAVDYAFQGLPGSVPVGTGLQLVNEGTEVHELIIVRRNDGVTQSWDELLAMPQEEALQLATIMGFAIAEPGQTSEDVIVVSQEGAYLAVCFVPQGTTEMPEFPEASPGAEPATSPGAAMTPARSPDASQGASASGEPGGPPHFLLGMRQEFTVTAAGSSPGPMPSAGPGMSPGHGTASPGASPAA